MVNLAGKYANVISRNPIASAVAGGLGAAGLATLGNLLSGESQTEEGGRLGLEALGAGALGAVAGARVPALRQRAAKTLRGINAVSYEHPAAQAYRQKMPSSEVAGAEFVRDLLGAGVKVGADANEVRAQLKQNLRQQQKAVNLAGIPAGLAMAGGLGGMVGGGIANLAAGMGLPGMGIDPEGYSSNNTPSAQFGVKSLASTQYV